MHMLDDGLLDGGDPGPAVDGREDVRRNHPVRVLVIRRQAPTGA